MAPRYLVDTNLWIYAAAKDSVAISFFDLMNEADWTGYSSITKIEVLGYPGLKGNEEHSLRSFMGCFNEVPVTPDIVEQAITLRQGHKMRIPDAIIAGSALVMKAVLVTRNSDDFKGIAKLQVINPYEKHPRPAT